ncbi:MAG TPA: serine/threonine-protein kinase [Gemmatimonadaceae bacterium]|nr:serine/threonine-protein kinase [Gemmatimonadaceae bacterium]
MTEADLATIGRLLLASRSGDESALAELVPMVSSSAKRWDRISSLFDAAVGLDRAGRTELLDRACREDAVLRAEVETLLHAADTTGDFIGASIARASGELAAGSTVVGPTLGAYRLVGELGVGGMGAVYLAERADTQYTARVAVKVLRGGLATPELERRFLGERQILADLVHPNIARLLDGGTAHDGMPYIVMEYIDGQPLDVWCETLGLRDRIRLFMTVCTAVQHAHQALVIHRDIKPSNILVTAAGQPKLLDFGIAKLLGSQAEATGETTALRIMTPSHASPEQIRGGRITTAADVYSLGVVLYQLLAGRLPFDIAGLSFAELERRVCDEEPPRPSVRAPPERARLLRGDLDNIVLKALRKDPARRYGSAGELAEDLRRWLAREPVSARPDTMPYRVSMFVRRHTVGVGAAAAIVFLLATLAVTSIVQARRVAVERDHAEAGRLTAQRVTDFLVRLFTVADPNVSGADTVTVRHVLDEGARRVLTELGDEPDVRATIAGTMGRVYRNLGLYEPARVLTDSALAIRRAIHPSGDTAIATALHEKAELFYTEGAYDSAAAIHREVLAIRRDRLGPRHPDVAVSLAGLAAALDELGSFEESELLYREALAIDRIAHGPQHELVATDMASLAAVLRSQAKYIEAITLLREDLAIGRRVHGSDHLDVAATLNQLSRTLTLAGRTAEAVPFVREALDIQRRVHRGPHPETAASLGNLAGILSGLGQYDESEATRRESLTMLRAVFGDDHPYIAATLNSLGDVQVRKGDLAAAESTYRESLAAHRRSLGLGHPNLGYPLTGLGLVLVDRGRPREAEPLLREASDVRRRGLPDGHWHVAASESALGTCLTALRRYVEAEPMLAGALATFARTFGEPDARTALARERLARNYDAWGRAADAERVRACCVAADSARW